jgi:hypothetical protein
LVRDNVLTIPSGVNSRENLKMFKVFYGEFSFECIMLVFSMAIVEHTSDKLGFFLLL